jgi:ribosomal protein L23
VRQLVDFFNMVAGYVATTVVTERSMKQRVKLLEKWVDVANHSFKIQVRRHLTRLGVVRIACVRTQRVSRLTQRIAFHKGSHIDARHRLRAGLCRSPSSEEDATGKRTLM